ncbi:ARM repeat-containing protein [Gloeopeniophorella convolvens]|nr:ARM repeat-containing protein [Gloeopeniophorella convolvens]
MEVAKRYVRTWVASPQDREIEDTASGIANGELKLVHVVKALGEYLTSEEDNLRNKGVEFLASVVGKCPPDKFNHQSAKVLVAFFTSKLEDTETIIPALKGILALTHVSSLIPDDIVDICVAIFAHVKMQALVQVQRYTVFSIFDSLIALHRNALKSMGDRFLSGYIALVDGEKDPRNLMLAFAIARVLAVEFDISAKFEDLFNVTFCYFPITFRPPPGDPYGITADDLKKALRSSLSGSPLFGNLAIPLFLDKINAGSPATKRDTLQTLSVCLPVYGSGIARNSARKLWSSLKLEIFQPTDPETEQEALNTTQVLIKTIYQDNTVDAEIDGLAKDACEECIQILKEPEKSQAKPAIKVLCAFMSTTPSVSRYTVSHVVPHLIELFVNPDELPNRGPVLTLLSSVIAAARDSTSKAADTEIFLLPFKDEVLGILITGLTARSSSLSAIEGLGGVITTPGLLDDEEVGFVVQKVNEVISGQNEELAGASEAALDLLKTISTKTPSHIAQITLPLLFSVLPDQAPARDDATSRERYLAALAALAHLCEHPDLFETLVVRLSVRLSLLRPPAADPEPTAAYAHALLSTLAGVLARKVARGDTDVQKYIERLVPRLFNLTAHAVLAPADGEGVPADPRIIGVAARLVNLVVQSLPASKQEPFASTLFAAYMKGEIGVLAVGDLKLPADTNFAPFEPTASEGQANLVVLFSEAVVALHPEVKVPVDDLGQFLIHLLNWSIRHAHTDAQRECAWHVVAAVVNKRAPDLDSFLAPIYQRFWLDQIATAHDHAARRHAISAWAWISRALLVRGHRESLTFVNRLFEIFNDAEVGWDAARAIGQIGAADKVLTKPNHAVIKILHAQKYANNVLPKIIDGAQDPGVPQRQTAYLVALAALIKAIPKQAYAHELPTLMPLLLRGLSLPDPALRAGVIDTLLAAAQADVDAGAKTVKDGNVVAEHAASLTGVMLRNSAAAEMPDIRVRVSALKYLAVLPKIVRYDVLHPQKATVLRELTKALDDPKRAVRKEAVDARTSWFTYSG